MSNENENIELRSEKVRNIIGQIPPRLMRIGISVIFFVFVSVLIGTYFFEYDYSIQTTANISALSDSILIELKIPVNQIEKIKKGQKVILSFDNIPSMYGHQLIAELPEISKNIHISATGGNYLSRFYIPENETYKTGNNIKIDGTIEVKAIIQTGKIRFFDRIIGPINDVFKHQEH
jgi:hypothetical protein